MKHLPRLHLWLVPRSEISTDEENTSRSFQGSDFNLYPYLCNIYTLRSSFKSRQNVQERWSKMIVENYSSLEPMANNDSNRTLSTIWHCHFQNSRFSMIFVRMQFYIKQVQCPSDCHRNPLICVNALCQSTCRFINTSFPVTATDVSLDRNVDRKLVINMRMRFQLLEFNILLQVYETIRK